MIYQGHAHVAGGSAEVVVEAGQRQILTQRDRRDRRRGSLSPPSSGAIGLRDDPDDLMRTRDQSLEGRDRDGRGAEENDAQRLQGDRPQEPNPVLPRAASCAS